MLHTKFAKYSLRSALLIGAASAAAIAVSAPASAQQMASNEQVETVVVTGTMVQRRDYETPSPLQVISADDIQQTGFTNTADVIRSISADNSGSLPTSFEGAFAFGAAAVSLRGLDSNSTLVLVDGHRVSNYPLADDGERTFTDLNTLPLDSVGQIQVLKDGATSSYGADAIAGVVNIMLKKEFQGVEATAETGESTEGGGFMDKFTARVGGGDLATDHFNIYFDVEFEHDQAISDSQRSFPFNTNDLSGVGGVNNNWGYASFTGSIYGTVTPAMETTPGNILSGQPISGALSQVLAPGGCGSLGTTVTNASGTFCEQDQALYDLVQPQTTRLGGYARATIDLNAHMEAYLDVSYYQYEDVQRTPPPQIQSGTPTNTNSIVLPAILSNGNVNPNDPFAVAGCVEGVTCHDALISYAFGDIAAGAHSYSHQLFTTVDLKGDFWGWNYDAALRISHTWMNYNQLGFLNIDALEAAVENGTYNFLNPSANSRALRGALAPTLTSMNTDDEDSLDMDATRSLFDLPGGPLQFAFGGQLRTEANYNPPLNPSNQAQGLGNTYEIGNRSIYAGFFEFDAPLLDTLEVDVSARFDHYSDFGNAFDPKAGIKWTPISQLAFRGTASTGFRAPGLAENANGASSGFVPTSVCGLPFGATICSDHSGDAYVSNPYDIEVVEHSFPGVRPETSEQFTGGMVLRPFEHYNVQASLDYYYIEKWDPIQFPNIGLALFDAFTGAALPPGYSVVYDAPDPSDPSAPPRPLIVTAPWYNAGHLITSGIDLGVSAVQSLTDDLSWSTQFNGTRIFEYNSILPGSPRLEYVGTQSPFNVGVGGGTPRTKFQWANTFTYRDLTVTPTVYYTSGLKNITSDLTGAGTTAYPGTFSGYGYQGAFWDVDLHLSYQITENVQLFGTIFNLLNDQPPFTPVESLYNNINFDPAFGQAGIVGRFWQIGVRIKD